MVDGEEAVLGRRQLVDLGADTGIEEDGGASQVFVGSSSAVRFLGSFVLRDQPRADARDALSAMRALGIGRLILLTGDREAAARQVGDALGMDRVVAEVLACRKASSKSCEPSRPRVVPS